MKQSGTTIAFVIVCIAVLVVAYGIGLGIRTLRFSTAKAQASATTEPEKPADEPEDKDVVAKSDPEAETPEEPEESQVQEEAFEEDRPEPGRMMGMRERFQNMSEEERQEAMARMRERFGGRGRGEGRGAGPFAQLSEEDREQFRADMEALRERADEMTDEEREQARAEIFEKYGIPQRGSGGGRRFGGDGGAPPPKGRACFVAQTPVWVSGKLVQISKVAAGHKVGIQLGGSSLLEQVQEHEGTFECRDIVLASGNILGVVDAHCFMLDSGQWITAQNLTSGLRLKTLTGSVSIKSVTKRAVPYTGKVYNLKVKNSDRYMVGKDAVIVRDY